jgi:hypothetical protein
MKEGNNFFSPTITRSFKWRSNVMEEKDENTQIVQPQRGGHRDAGQSTLNLQNEVFPMTTNALTLAEGRTESYPLGHMWDTA